MRKLIYFFAQLIIEVIELSFRQALTMYPGVEDLGKENVGLGKSWLDETQPVQTTRKTMENHRK